MADTAAGPAGPAVDGEGAAPAAAADAAKAKTKSRGRVAMKNGVKRPNKAPFKQNRIATSHLLRAWHNSNWMIFAIIT